jgi:hypothetical protein
MSQPSTCSPLLYRYLFYGWLFRDAGSGNLWERAANLQHNRSQARWLPLYVWRWAVIGAILFGMAAFIEIALASPVLAAWLYVPSALTVPGNAVTVLCWLGLSMGRS